MGIKAGLEGDNNLVNYSEKEAIRKSNIVFKHITRRLNVGADYLAKQGNNRNSLVEGWFK